MATRGRPHTYIHVPRHTPTRGRPHTQAIPRAMRDTPPHPSPHLDQPARGIRAGEATGLASAATGVNPIATRRHRIPKVARHRTHTDHRAPRLAQPWGIEPPRESSAKRLARSLDPTMQDASTLPRGTIVQVPPLHYRKRRSLSALSGLEPDTKHPLRV